jgi:hypothetical protein
MLRKDDPIYYRKKINDLIKQALKEGLEVNVKIEAPKRQVKVYFKASNGDIAGVNLIESEVK